MTAEQELTKQKIEALEKKLVADKAKMAKIVTETIKLNREMEATQLELAKLKRETKEKADENNSSMERIEKEYDEFQNQILDLEKILKITN